MIDAPRIHELEIQFRFTHLRGQGSLSFLSRRGTKEPFESSVSLSLPLSLREAARVLQR